MHSKSLDILSDVENVETSTHASERASAALSSAKQALIRATMTTSPANGSCKEQDKDSVMMQMMTEWGPETLHSMLHEGEDFFLPGVLSGDTGLCGTRMRSQWEWFGDTILARGFFIQKTVFG